MLLICVKNDGSVSCLQVSRGERGPCITQNQFISAGWREVWTASNKQPSPSTKIIMEMLMTSQY